MKAKANRRGLFLIVVLLFLSCKPSYKGEVREYLSIKYGEDFRVLSDNFNYFGHPQAYQFRAIAQDRGVFFTGEHNADFTWYRDSYLDRHLNYLYTMRLRERLNRLGIPLLIIGEVQFSEELYNQDQINLDEVELASFFNESQALYISLYCYYTNQSTENRSMVIEELHEILMEYEEHPDAFLSLHLYELDEDFLLVHSMKSLDIDRRKGEYPLSAHEDTLMEYSTARLDLYIHSGEPRVPLTVQIMEEYLQEVSKDSFRPIPANLNYMAEEDNS